MNSFKSYLDICRISNLPTVWTNVLAAALLTTGTIPASLPLLILAGSAFYMAGMCLNDFCDAEHDRAHRKTRPIPSGRISENSALLVSIILFASGLVLLAIAPNLTGVISGLVLILTIVAYDFYHKGNPLSVVLMASCRFLLFLVTSLALTNQASQLVLLGGSVQFIYVVLISSVARLENKCPNSFSFPVIPAMIACISLLDGALLAIIFSPWWFAVGIIGSAITWFSQQYVRGD